MTDHGIGNNATIYCLEDTSTACLSRPMLQRMKWRTAVQDHASTASDSLTESIASHFPDLQDQFPLAKRQRIMSPRMEKYVYRMPLTHTI
jgi:hypothetical protein